MSALPSVEPLPPGTRPTEPGWYVMRQPYGGETIVEVKQLPNGRVNVLRVGSTSEITLAALEEGGFTFVARIYPDRIGQE